MNKTNIKESANLFHSWKTLLGLLAMVFVGGGVANGISEGIHVNSSNIQSIDYKVETLSNKLEDLDSVVRDTYTSLKLLEQNSKFTLDKVDSISEKIEKMEDK